MRSGELKPGNFDPIHELLQTGFAIGREATDRFEDPEMRSTMNAAVEELGHMILGKRGDDMRTKPSGGSPKGNAGQSTQQPLDIKVLVRLMKQQDSAKAEHLAGLIEQLRGQAALIVLEIIDALDNTALGKFLITASGFENPDDLLKYFHVHERMKKLGMPVEITEDIRKQAYANIGTAGKKAQWVYSVLGDASDDKERDEVLRTVHSWSADMFEEVGALDPESRRRAVGVFPKWRDFVAGLFGRGATEEDITSSESSSDQLPQAVAVSTQTAAAFKKLGIPFQPLTVVAVPVAQPQTETVEEA